jgi:hypothetical protein
LQCGYQDHKRFLRDFENLFLSAPESFQLESEF